MVTSLLVVCYGIFGFTGEKTSRKKHLKKQANKQTIKVVDNQWKYKAILISYACILIIGLFQSYRLITSNITRKQMQQMTIV